MSSLDVREKQILVRYDDDAHFTLHHRLLLVELGNGKWVVCTPDKDIEVCDLTNHRVLPLRKNEAFPRRAWNDMYIFDALGAGQLDELIRDALELARVDSVRHACICCSAWSSIAAM